MNTAYIGLGANLGDLHKTIIDAIEALASLPTTRVIERSSIFGSAPIEADGDDYLNAVACIHTRLSPTDLLQALLEIEYGYGRIRSYRNAPRELDLDILLYNQLSINTDTLVIPHPRLTQRAFALIPLLQIAPLIHIPGLGPAHAFAQGVADQRIYKFAA